MCVKASSSSDAHTLSCCPFCLRHEVDPDLLYFREFEVSCTYAPGYTELPKTFKISLEPSG